MTRSGGIVPKTAKILVQKYEKNGNRPNLLPLSRALFQPFNKSPANEGLRAVYEVGGGQRAVRGVRVMSGTSISSSEMPPCWKVSV